ncbi:MAG: PIN domain-containing protein [Xanthomonadales bacterium]|nr:PIN domain-containing protein [Xanthomonadales bacterium]
MVFLDASAIIYLLEGEPTVRQAARETLMRQAEPRAEGAIAVSALSLLECRVHPARNADLDRLAAFDAFFGDPGLTIVDLTRDVIDCATQLRAQNGIRTPDALQAASCFELAPDTPFVTGDRDFRRVPALNVHLIG